MPGGGAPPDGAAYRCQARLKRRRGKQCGRYALKTSRFCQFHGGRTASKKVRNFRLPLFFRKQLSNTLQNLVEECLEKAPAEQLQLFEELALTRATTQQAVALFTASQQNGVSEDLRAEAAALLRVALKDVQGMCEAATRVSYLTKDKTSIHDIAYVVAQVVRIAYRVFDDDLVRAQEFERLIKEEIKLPVGDAAGTNITPDQDVTEMDETVPQC